MLDFVMSVDDDQVTLMLNELMLEQSSFSRQMLKATNGKAAMDFFDEQLLLTEDQRTLPSLILLDLNMPIMDGWQFLDSFSKRFPQFEEKVKIVILSSSPDPEDKKRAFEYPEVLSFIPKSLTVTSLEKLKLHPHFSAAFN